MSLINTKMPSPMISNDRYSYMDEASIHPLLICKFCTKPFVEPVATTNGDRFCRSCITNVLLHSSSSENSRANIISNEQQSSKLQSLIPVTEPIVLAMLDSLLVRCTKCGEIDIKRGVLGEHENQVCTQALVLCGASDYKCTWLGTRIELNEHSAQCKFQKIRPALEHIFHEHDQLKERIQNLETQIDEIMNTRMINKIDFNS